MAIDILGGFASLFGPDIHKAKYPKDLSLDTELGKMLAAGTKYQPGFQQLGLEAYQQYGGQYGEEFWKQNPLLAELLGQTHAQVGEQLELGSEMSPIDIRRISQEVGAGQSARGFGQGSNRDRFEQAVALAMQSEQLRQQRLGNAMNLLGITRSVSPDTMGAVNSGLGGQFTSQLFPLAEDITSLNYNAKLDRARAVENANSAERGGFRQFVGQVVGGAMGMGGAAMCWVAREVYGADNPRWQLFRYWLLTQAPGWFRKLYRIYGPAFARWIADKPRLKTIIRHWMDARIESLHSAFRIPNSAFPA